eukprot:15477533-Alexandrium_andersonii.AAC.1
MRLALSSRAAQLRHELAAQFAMLFRACSCVLRSVLGGVAACGPPTQSSEWCVLAFRVPVSGGGVLSAA